MFIATTSVASCRGGGDSTQTILWCPHFRVCLVFLELAVRLLHPLPPFLSAWCHPYNIYNSVTATSLSVDEAQKCSLMTLLSGDIRLMRIFERHQTTVGLSTTAIFRFSLAISSETLEIRPALLYSDTQSVVSFSVIPKCVTLNDLEWLFRVKSCFLRRFIWFRPCDFRKIIAWKLINMDTYGQR